MVDNSLTIDRNRFFALVLKSPIQRGSLSIINSVTNISRLGTFKELQKTVKYLGMILLSDNNFYSLATKIIYRPLGSGSVIQDPKEIFTDPQHCRKKSMCKCSIFTEHFPGERSGHHQRLRTCERSAATVLAT